MLPSLLSRPLTLAEARQIIVGSALCDGPTGSVGLELEQHVHDVAEPGVRPDPQRVLAAVAGDLPGGSAVTLEPGGQLELSGPPSTLSGAVASLRADLAVVDARLAAAGLVGLLAGADPVRPSLRVTTGPRYAAMAEHFRLGGYHDSARVMMCSTASLQVNLDAGPAAGWADRVALAQAIGPVLVAVSATSPSCAGIRTGWASSRMKAWGELDPPRTRSLDLAGSGDPREAWADLALAAPVMLTREGDDFAPAQPGVPFVDWLTGEVRLAGRTATRADLEYHLTTLWPPVRLRGFLEIRPADAGPRWAGIAAFVTALLDDGAAAETARDVCAPVADAWESAARLALADPALRRAADACRAAVLPALERLGCAELVADVAGLW